MLRNLSFLILLTFFSVCQAQQNIDSLNSQTITYQTSKAQDLYLVWGQNYFEKIPDKIYWPPNSFLKDKLLYSRMIGSNNSFSITIKLPPKSYINYMFWAAIDDKGDSTDGWDTNWKRHYASWLDGHKSIIIDDSKLWMPEEGFKFSVLSSGFFLLECSFAIAVILLILYRRKLSFRSTNLIVGLLIASFIIVCLIRMEMNGLLKQNQFMIFGAVSYDLFYLIILAVLFFSLTRLLSSFPVLKTIFSVLFFVIIIFSALLSVLNIEMVKHFGKPLNYQWLYYSDIMKGADAKNAIAYKLDDKLYYNILFILLSVLTLGLTWSFLPLMKRKPKWIFITVISLLLVISIYQVRSEKYVQGKISNPVLELISSYYSAGKNPNLLSMKLPKEISDYFMEKEEPLSEIKIIDSLSISNVLIFVLESTPKRYISVYDTTYDVTPNLSKWKNIASIFPNMYSHIPTTTNSMATMISGMYPLISYKSIIKDNLSQSLPSIGAVLKAQNWENSLLVSSDLAFGSMDVYAQHAGFNLIKDNKSIHCDYPSFHITQTQLDGLDDRCLAHEYLNWIDSLHDKKKFSILWTNQTHYPYFINSENEKKYTDDKELNRYLNGLKSSDEAFGILMEGLQKRNLLNQSLIIVVGDHGESFGTHDQKGHGNTVYEEEVNVPCLIYNPFLCSGTVHDVIGGMVDIAPTISHLLRIPLPVVCEGKSLFSVRKNARTFFLCPYSNFVLGTRTQKWKFIYNATSNTNELYDIQNDPMELNDLSKKFPDVVKFEYQMLGGWVQFHNNRLQEISKGANTNVQ